MTKLKKIDVLDMDKIEIRLQFTGNSARYIPNSKSIQNHTKMVSIDELVFYYISHLLSPNPNEEC